MRQLVETVCFVVLVACAVFMIALAGGILLAP